MNFDSDEEENFIDIDTINIYRDSSYDHIEKIMMLLFELEFDKSNLNNILVEINRSAHSLKGDSNSLGFIEIGSVAHKMESFIRSIQDDFSLFNDQALSDLFEYMSQIKELLDLKFKNDKKDSSENDIQLYENLKIFLLEVVSIISSENIDISNISQIFKKSINLLDIDYKNEDINNINLILKDSFNNLSLENYEKSKFSILTSISDINSILNQIINKNETNLLDKTEKDIDSDYKDEDKTIRVSLQKIDSLIDYSSELISNFNVYDYRILEIGNIYSKLIDIDTSKDYSDLYKVNKMIFDLMSKIKKDNLTFYSIINNLNDDIKKTGMLSAKNLLEQMRIVARTSSVKLNKSVKFISSGEEVKLDIFLLEKIKDPISHIIRNAIDHGIEDKNTRLANNKSIESILSLNLFISGNEVVFEIKDDGKGINYDKVKNKALKLGLIDNEKYNSITKEELNIIMFMPGFSTSDTVTDISGRGVGLDVVKNTIENLGGSISINSLENIGTTFTISIPLKLTNFEALIIKLLDKKFAIPVSFVKKLVHININQIIEDNNQQFVLIGGEKIKVIDLCSVLNIDRENFKLLKEFFVMIISIREQSFAFIIDELSEIKEIVMKDFGGQIKKRKNISGITILGDGTPILVLNPYELVSSFEMSFINSFILEKIKQEFLNKELVIKKKALVVDDSITTRTLEKNILESSGFEVRIAKDGLEGTSVLQEFNPDIVITDCEMPKMNGYEFTKWIRNSNYKDLPVIMVTSLADNEFKLKGLNAGVDSYIVKGEFNQETFLDTIETLLL